MNIGYLGLGIMGSAMAANLLRAGHSVTVWNRTTSKTSPLAKLGASVGDSPADVASKVQVLCINVTDTPDVETLLFGKQGVAAGAKRGLVVVDHSTISPDATRDFAKRLKKQGVTLLDAPVSGGDVGARNGTLSIMVGGDAKVFDRAKPVLEAVGKNILHVGPSGAGQACKACNQIAVLLTLAGVSEAIAFARSLKLDVNKMLDVVGAGAGASWQLSNLGPKIVKKDFAPGFMIDLALKDLGIVLASAKRSKLKLDGAKLAQRYLKQVQAKKGGRLGTQAMAKAVG
ncbi:MAG: NAD(P)-dependent oxidoreductase [Tepidisphaeraceae bacterium]